MSPLGEFYSVQEVARNLVEFSTTFRRQFSGVCRDSLSKFPKGRASLNAVLGVVAHQDFLDLFPLLFQERASLSETADFVFHIDLDFGRSLNLVCLTFEGLSAEQTFGQVSDG